MTERVRRGAGLGVLTRALCVIRLSMCVLRGCGCLFHILLIIRRVMRLLFMVFPKVMVADSKECENNALYVLCTTTSKLVGDLAKSHFRDFREFVNLSISNFKFAPASPHALHRDACLPPCVLSSLTVCLQETCTTSNTYHNINLLCAPRTQPHPLTCPSLPSYLLIQTT